jgi:1-acyl-sn-glycerol-3-phosphate acyltransferase
MVILRQSKAYAISRPILKLFFKSFYKKIEVRGLENIPKDKPLIFAPNHQNALMDPLAIVFTSSPQTVFLARSDIFINWIINWILNRLKILPVYRLRDGAKKLAKNDEIFELCVEILRKNRSIALFPEAQHNDHHRLLPLKKAISRIGFKAIKESEYNLDIQIIPVGIYHKKYEAFRSKLEVNYGSPISMLKYKELIAENEVEATRALNKDLENEIKNLMVNIEDKENYDVYNTIRETHIAHINKINNEIKESQEIIRKVEAMLDQNNRLPALLKENTTQFNDLLNKTGTDYKDINALNKSGHWVYNYFKLLVLLPLYIYGGIQNAPLFVLLNKIITKNIKDTQFHATMKFAGILVLFPLLHIILSIIFYQITGIWWLSLIYFISLPLTGIFAFDYSQKLKFTKHHLKLLRFKRKQPESFNKLIKLHENILKLKTD